MKRPMRIIQRKDSKSSEEVGELKVRKPGKQRKYRCYVFYGPAGTGKTTLASTFPGPIAMGDFRDQGDDSISDVDDLEVYQIETWDDAETFYWQAKKGKLKDSAGKPFKPETLVIDTATNWQQMCIEHVLEMKKKKSSKMAGDWGSMTKQEWGEVASLMKQWLALYKSLEMNIVFLAQQRVFNADEDEGSDSELTPEVGARLSPSVKDALNAAADVIGSTFVKRKIIVKEVKGKKVKRERSIYCLRVGPNPVYITKIRKPRKTDAPSVIEDPVYEDILSVIKGEA